MICCCYVLYSSIVAFSIYFSVGNLFGDITVESLPGEWKKKQLISKESIILIQNTKNWISWKRIIQHSSF